MAKVHLRANKLTDKNIALAICASEPASKGRVRPNRRNTYRYMASEIVSFDDFKALPDNQRCAHCMDRGLIVRNKQRREKGLPPVAHLFD